MTATILHMSAYRKPRMVKPEEQFFNGLGEQIDPLPCDVETDPTDPAYPMKQKSHRFDLPFSSTGVLETRDREPT